MASDTTTQQPREREVTHDGRTYCAECDDMVRYRVTGDGFWECTVCGFAIDCVECGLTMHRDHDCQRDIERNR